MSRTISIGLILLALALPAGADVQIAPVKGYIEFTSAEVSCPTQSGACMICVNDENTTADHRLMIAIGETYPFVTTTGLLEGVVRPFVEIDGVRLTPDLLPCGAYFRCGVNWSDYFTPNPCGATPAGVTYQIGSMPEVTVTKDGSDFFDIPATDANEVPFRISVCSQFFYWGAGCNVSGSSDKSWKLFVPAAVNALLVESGDADPLAASGSDFAIDFLNSPGGVVMVSHAPGDPPVTPAIEHLQGYWDVHSDLVTGSFSADVSFGFDASVLPPEVDPGAITVAVYNIEAGMWNILPTTVDVPGETATVTTDRLSKFVLLGGVVLPAEPASWGRVKALYGAE